MKNCVLLAADPTLKPRFILKQIVHSQFTHGGYFRTGDMIFSESPTVSPRICFTKSASQDAPMPFGFRRHFQFCLSPGFFRPLAISVILLSAAGAARAANIVVDGGFETAGASNVYYAGSSLDGGSWNVTKGAVYIDSGDPYVYAGNNSLNLTYANLYAPNTLSQVLSTIAGQSYNVSFWADADSANTFSLLENGLYVSGSPLSIADNGFPGLTSNSSLFVNYSGTFTASSAATTLSLSAVGNPAIGSQDGSVMIDNVSVQPATAVTPEPGSFLLLFTGAFGLGAKLRQRRSASPVQAQA